MRSVFAEGSWTVPFPQLTIFKSLDLLFLQLTYRLKHWKMLNTIQIQRWFERILKYIILFAKIHIFIFFPLWRVILWWYTICYKTFHFYGHIQNPFLVVVICNTFVMFFDIEYILQIKMSGKYFFFYVSM